MARSRLLRPQFFSDPQFCRLSIGAQHLCLGLIPHMDRNGVFYGHPQTVKSHIFPHATKMRCSDVERWLKELHDAARTVGCRHEMPRVRLFNYADTAYLIDLNFALHQNIYSNDPDIYGIPVETRLRVDRDLVEDQRQLSFDPLNLNLNLNLNQDDDQKTQASREGCGAPLIPGKSECDDDEIRRGQEKLIEMRRKAGLHDDGSEKIPGYGPATARSAAAAPNCEENAKPPEIQIKHFICDTWEQAQQKAKEHGDMGPLEVSKRDDGRWEVRSVASDNR